jgi:Histidine phosphatase superfamily (branch 1)
VHAGLAGLCSTSARMEEPPARRFTPCSDAGGPVTSFHSVTSTASWRPSVAEGSWDGPDAGRPLSPAGLDQAEGLVLRLGDYPVERILWSPTVRCQQTIQPLARDRLLGIEPVTALGVDADPSEILELFWDRRLDNVVLSPMARASAGCYRSSSATGWSPWRRCTGPKAQPGCCSAPPRHRGTSS